jgi:hypothetical protein
MSSSANGSRECAPDDRLQQMIQYSETVVVRPGRFGLLDTPLVAFAKAPASQFFLSPGGDLAETGRGV